ncbi:MAG: GNAT family N-acetyltransferase [Peptostreptococcaceae bacterium]|nr:GNAT family N-acetyltransferase [Peptostreptococcaceae bacterium]
MYFKKLIGRKCYLSPICPEDALQFTKWLNDTETSIGLMSTRLLIEPREEEEILKKLQKEPYNFSVIDKETDELLGNAGLMNIDWIDRKAEAGLFLGDPERLGKGYGSDALSLLLDFGFHILNLHNIYLQVYEYNRIAKRCYEKVGFREAGRLRESKRIGGKVYDTIYMDILAGEFISPYIADCVQKRERIPSPLEQLFLSGESYDQMLEETPDEHREKFLKYRGLLFSETNRSLLEDYKKRFEGLDRNYRLLIFTESYCPDCHINTAPISLLESLPNFSLSFVRRDGNEKVLEDFQEDGSIKIPTFLLMDEKGELLGYLTERPLKVKERLLSFASETERTSYLAGDYLFEILDDILSLIEKTKIEY